MTDQASALAALVLGAIVCASAVGFGVGRLTSRSRVRSGTSSDSRSEAALALALELGLGRLKAQQKAMSDRAAASEQLNSQIIASLTAGLLLVDDQGRVELINPAGLRLLGLAEMPMGESVGVALASVPALVALIEQCRSRLESIARRTVTIEAVAGTLHLGVTVSQAGLGDRSEACICLFTDITGVVEMEEQLRMKEALARLGELTAGLAHEFRNGLATIHGYARLLEPERLPEQYRPYVESLRVESDQLGRVVTNFLNFARPERLLLVPVSLHDVLARSVDEARRELPPGGRIDIVGEFGYIDGDEQLLKQAMDNLLRNAVQACQRVGSLPLIVVSGSVDRPHGSSHVTIDDNGPGVPEADRLRVFQPFVTTRAAGTGLGLAIVQKIVLAHNGRIVVTGAPTRGARFELTFPLRPADSLAKAS